MALHDSNSVAAAERIMAQQEEIERVRDAAETALAWLDRWAMHVGKCPADENCTCGLVAVRHELRTALSPE